MCVCGGGEKTDEECKVYDSPPGGFKDPVEAYCEGEEGGEV